MKDLKTCGNCKNVFIGGNPPRMPLAACRLNDNVVPHGWDGKEFTFWRIPESCLREEGVHKSKKQAPEKEWVVKTLSDFTLTGGDL